MTARWRLFQAYFNGPGEYKFGTGSAQVTLNVSEDRIFEISGPIDFPINVIANVVDSKRDNRTEYPDATLN